MMQKSRLEQYGLMIAGGAGVAFAGAAAGAVVEVSGLSLQLTDTSGPILIDVDGGGNDIQFDYYSGFGNPATRFNTVGIDGDAVTSGFGTIANLGLGDVVAPGDVTLGSVSYYNGNLARAGSFGPEGDFNPAGGNPDNGFVGVTFTLDTGVDAGTKVYGWVQVEGVSVNTLTVVAYGYETDGSAITIPEPGSLALLAMGAAGVMSRRNRKSA